jgi:hypothetical protein
VTKKKSAAETRTKEASPQIHSQAMDEETIKNPKENDMYTFDLPNLFKQPFQMDTYTKMFTPWAEAGLAAVEHMGVYQEHLFHRITETVENQNKMAVQGIENVAQMSKRMHDTFKQQINTMIHH